MNYDRTASRFCVCANSLVHDPDESVKVRPSPVQAGVCTVSSTCRVCEGDKHPYTECVDHTFISRPMRPNESVLDYMSGPLIVRHLERCARDVLIRGSYATKTSREFSAAEQLFEGAATLLSLNLDVDPEPVQVEDPSWVGEIKESKTVTSVLRSSSSESGMSTDYTVSPALECPLAPVLSGLEFSYAVLVDSKAAYRDSRERTIAARVMVENLASEEEELRLNWLSARAHHHQEWNGLKPVAPPHSVSGSL